MLVKNKIHIHIIVKVTLRLVSSVTLTKANVEENWLTLPNNAKIHWQTKIRIDRTGNYLFLNTDVSSWVEKVCRWRGAGRSQCALEGRSWFHLARLEESPRTPAPYQHTNNQITLLDDELLARFNRLCPYLTISILYSFCKIGQSSTGAMCIFSLGCIIFKRDWLSSS